MTASGPLHLIALSHGDANGTTAAVVAPGWGANVVALCFQAADWAWPAPILEAVDIAAIAQKPPSYGMPILAPTPGRVGRNQSGDFTYRGREYRLRPGRHGFLRSLAWEVTDRSADALTCEVEVVAARTLAEHGFPFHFKAEHRIELGPGRLRSRVRVTNTGDTVQPIAVGWHPYLHRAGACRVRIPAAGRWQLNDQPEPTPTGQILAVEGRDDFRLGRVVPPEEAWDDLFTDLAAEDGATTCWVEQESSVLFSDGSERALTLRRWVRLAQSEEAGACPIPHLQLFTPKGRAAISLEPLSAPPDALNLLANGHPRAGVCECLPGASAAFEVVLGLGWNPE